MTTCLDCGYNDILNWFLTEPDDADGDVELEDLVMECPNCGSDDCVKDSIAKEKGHDPDTLDNMFQAVADLAAEVVEPEWEEIHDCRYKRVWSDEYDDWIVLHKYPESETVTVSAVIGEQSAHQALGSIDEAEERIEELKQLQRRAEVEVNPPSTHCAECEA